MPESVVLGIDTSNYTTSVAIMTEGGELLANIKRPLPVKPGECGLRQSDAVFAHVKNLPSAMAEAREVLAGRNPVAVGVSEKPRNMSGSYMPCFLSGVAAAESIAAAAGIPVYRFSHQCGHLMAALYSSGREDLLATPFGAFHVSGGTTDMLRVHAEGTGFIAGRVGGTADVNAGQIIDRIGVFMGLSFPAGPAMEELARSYSGKIPKKHITLKEGEVNLSGLENMAKKLYSETGDKAQTAAFVLRYIAEALSALTDSYEARFGTSSFIYAGGVMSNSLIKEYLAKRHDASFAEPAMSADNAVGIARLTVRAHFH